MHSLRDGHFFFFLGAERSWAANSGFKSSNRNRKGIAVQRVTAVSVNEFFSGGDGHSKMKVKNF